MANPQKSKDIDDYISKFPADVQAILQKVRETIRRAAPEAKETISYMMPAFKQHGILVYFAAWEKHIGMYPPISGNKTLEKAIARYAGPKGVESDDQLTGWIDLALKFVKALPAK